MRRIALSALAAALLLFTLSISASASNHNCGDYISQAAAQFVYDADTSDPYGLDGPPGPTSAGQPGVACETYDYANNPGTNPGLVDGAIPTADDGDDNGSSDDNGDNGAGDDNGSTPTLPSVGTGTSSVSGAGASVLGLMASLMLLAGAMLRRSVPYRS